MPVAILFLQLRGISICFIVAEGERVENVLLNCSFVVPPKLTCDCAHDVICPCCGEGKSVTSLKTEIDAVQALVTTAAYKVKIRKEELYYMFSYVDSNT